MSANRLLFLAAIPLFLVLLVVAVLSVRFAADERAEQGWVIHSYEVINQISRVLTDAQGAETGQRGFIITRDPVYLVPYHAASARVGTDLNALKTLTEDNPRQQARAMMLGKIATARLVALNRALALAPLAAPPPPQMLSAMAEGRRQMVQLRAVVAQASAEEDRLLSDRIAARRVAESYEISSVVIAALVALLILLGAAVALVRSNVGLIRSEKERTVQLNTLQATLDNIRDGVAVFDATGALSVFNRTFFIYMDYPEPMAKAGTTLDENSRNRPRPQPRDIRRFADGVRRGRQSYRHLVVNGRELDVYRAAVAGGGFSWRPWT